LAIYERLREIGNDSEKDHVLTPAQQETLFSTRGNIKNKLMHNGKPRLHLLPRDAEVYENYLGVFADKSKGKYGTRAFAKRYKYIQELLDNEDEIQGFDNIIRFYDKLNSAELLRISVGDTADAFAVFSSLNSKGLPLTLIDLLKTVYLERALKSNIPDEDAQANWDKLTDIFTGEDNEPNSTAITQFLLNNYDAFIGPKQKSITKRQALKEYNATFQKRDAEYMDELIEKAKIFSYISPLIDPDDSINLPNKLVSQLQSLEKLDPTQTYPLLMLMLDGYITGRFNTSSISKVLTYLIHFYVRRNIVLRPKSSNIRAKIIEITHRVRDSKESKDLLAEVKQTLGSIEPSDEDFRLALDSGVYDIAPKTVRYALITVERKYGHYFDKQTKDTLDDISTTGTGRPLPIWSIEHILPEADNLKNGWPEMISPDNPSKATEIQQQFMHKIGNLTLTGYNPEMSDKSFEYKKNYKSPKSNKFAGLRTELALNNSILDPKESWENKTSWTTADINRRTDWFKTILVPLFSL